MDIAKAVAKLNKVMQLTGMCDSLDDGYLLCGAGIYEPSRRRKEPTGNYIASNNSTFISLKTDGFIKNRVLRLRVNATYSLFNVCLDISSGEKSVRSSPSSLAVRITQDSSTVSPFEYDQFIERNGYELDSLYTSFKISSFCNTAFA